MSYVIRSVSPLLPVRYYTGDTLAPSTCEACDSPCIMGSISWTERQGSAKRFASRDEAAACIERIWEEAGPRVARPVRLVPRKGAA